MPSPRKKSQSPKSSNGIVTLAASQLSENELRELVQTRAYELYLQRGNAEGDEVSDWLRAEFEVLAAINQLSAPSNGATQPARRTVRRPPPKPVSSRSQTAKAEKKSA